MYVLNVEGRVLKMDDLKILLKNIDTTLATIAVILIIIAISNCGTKDIKIINPQQCICKEAVK